MGAPDWMARAGHGDVDSVVRIIRNAAAAALPAPNAAEQAVARKYSQDELMPVMVEALREDTGERAPALAASKPISK
jgi:hypothetical protein